MEDPLAQSWDDSLRKLVYADPQAFVHLVDPDKASRELLLALVQARFPKLFRLTKQLINTIDHTSVLQTLILKISTASNLEEARQYLLDVSQEDTND